MEPMPNPPTGEVPSFESGGMSTPPTGCRSSGSQPDFREPSPATTHTTEVPRKDSKRGRRKVKEADPRNDKERERTKSMNDAFARLREVIPSEPTDKRSNIQTLQLAAQYIQFLGELLNDERHAESQSTPPAVPSGASVSNTRSPRGE